MKILQAKNITVSVCAFVVLSIAIALSYKLGFILLHNLFTTPELSYSLLVNSGYQLTTRQLLSSLLLAPVFETVIFVVLVHSVMMRISNNVSFYVFVSALLFGLIHASSLFIQLGAFCVGIIFAFSYVYYLKRTEGSKDKAALFVMLIHAMYNFVFLHL